MSNAATTRINAALRRSQSVGCVELRRRGPNGVDEQFARNLSRRRCVPFVEKGGRYDNNNNTVEQSHEIRVRWRYALLAAVEAVVTVKAGWWCRRVFFALVHDGPLRKGRLCHRSADTCPCCKTSGHAVETPPWQHCLRRSCTTERVAFEEETEGWRRRQGEWTMKVSLKVGRSRPPGVRDQPCEGKLGFVWTCTRGHVCTVCTNSVSDTRLLIYTIIHPPPRFDLMPQTWPRRAGRGPARDSAQPAAVPMPRAPAPPAARP